MHFYEYFEWLCKCKGLTIPQAYNGANINKGTISRWRSAFADGIEVHPATKAAIALSRYFNIPIMNVYDMQWSDGVCAEEWIARGARFRSFRELYGYSDSKVAKIALLSENDVFNFENYGVPIPVSAIAVMCNAMSIPYSDVCIGCDAPHDAVSDVLQNLRDEDRALLDVARGMTAEQVRKMTEFAKTMKGDI